MKRRGFLGFLAGGAVAVPGMAKQAVASSMADLSLEGISGVVAGDGGFGPVAASIGQSDWAAKSLAQIVGRTAQQHEYFKRRTRVDRLDPDLATYRSLALHAKIAMQRDRDYQRNLESERGYFEAVVAGWFDD